MIHRLPQRHFLFRHWTHNTFLRRMQFDTFLSHFFHCARMSLLLVFALCTPFDLLAKSTERPGIFVLGVDGMDPVILERMMQEGKMPNFKKLSHEGTLQELGTSTPPQSPVAWSNFVTGMNPGGHGIYDFIHRDPKTYMPVSSAVKPNLEPPKTIEILDYVIPLGGAGSTNNRSGTPFWDILSAAGVPTEVYRIPGNYPVTPSKALTLSGMGTVDMRGDFGTYTWYTDRTITNARDLKADLTRITIDDTDLDGTPDTITARLKGPPNFLHLAPGAHPGPNDYLTVPLTIHIDPEENVIWLRTKESEAILQEGEWSDWLPVTFDTLPMGLLPLHGIVRFYAKEIRPQFQLYASPVNISGKDPAQTITTPKSAAHNLFRAIGYYYTQGMPEETNALKDKLFNDDDYKKQVALVEEDTERLLGYALERFRPGMTTFVYLSDIDLQSHMLWRHGDPKYPIHTPHPAWEPEIAKRHAHDIEAHYRAVDRKLGRIRAVLPPDTLLFVMSDHGFQPYTRKFHLNAWLRDEGYLVLKNGRRTGKITQGDVDWSKTRAYGLGFNGLYLNRAGREAQGIVQAAEVSSLLDEIAQKLLEYTDPKTHTWVVLRADRADVSYTGSRINEAPDLIVGYDREYGCSDASTLGEITNLVIEDNTDYWSGNHLMAPEVVPGILLTNAKLSNSGYDLTDVTMTLLDYYGVAPAPGMTGTSFFSKTPKQANLPKASRSQRKKNHMSRNTKK